MVFRPSLCFPERYLEGCVIGSEHSVGLVATGLTVDYTSSVVIVKELGNKAHYGEFVSGFLGGGVFHLVVETEAP